LIRETGHPTGFFTILDFIIRQFMQDFNALEGKSLAELREIGRALGVGNVMLKKKELLEQIRAVALVAAVVSIAAKEVLYRYTVRAGRRVQSPSMVANAWHHRSDALSSLGTLLGIGCAYFLGDKWRIADPVAALAVSVFIFKIAFDLIRDGVEELLERALPPQTERRILDIVASEPGVHEPHNLRTRRIGTVLAMEVHIRVDGRMSVARSHSLTVEIERRLKQEFGPETLVSIHVEPLKTADDRAQESHPADR